MIEYSVGVMRNGKTYLIKTVDGQMFFPTTTFWHRLINETDFVVFSNDFSLLEDKQDIIAYETEVIPWLKAKIILSIINE